MCLSQRLGQCHKQVHMAKVMSWQRSPNARKVCFLSFGCHWIPQVVRSTLRGILGETVLDDNSHSVLYLALQVTGVAELRILSTAVYISVRATSIR